MPNHLRRSDESPRQEWASDKSGPYCLEISFTGPHGYCVAEFTNKDQRVTRGEKDCIIIEGLSHERVIEIRNAIGNAVREARNKTKAQRLSDIEVAMGKIRQKLGEVDLDDHAEGLAQVSQVAEEFHGKVIRFPNVIKDKERSAILNALDDFEYLKWVA